MFVVKEIETGKMKTVEKFEDANKLMMSGNYMIGLLNFIDSRTWNRVMASSVRGTMGWNWQ